MNKVIYLAVSIMILFFGCKEKLEERIVSIHPNNAPAVIEFFRASDSSKQPVKIVRYYFNGEKQEESLYKNGKKDGLSIMWYLNGKKMYEATYSEDAYHGKFIQWYDNGKKEYEAEYNMGQPIGTWKYYNNDGSLQKEQKF